MRPITVTDIRAFVQDRSIEDNDLALDLAFSDEEIRDAMVRAARDFNSIPPFVMTVNPDCLPGDTNLFLDGVAKQLYLSEKARLTRNDVDYTAGGVSTNLVAKRIQHLDALIKYHSEVFHQTAQDIKVTHNLNQFYFHA